MKSSSTQFSNANSLYDLNLLVRILNCVVAPNAFKIIPRHGRRIENAALVLLYDILLGFPRDRYLAILLVRWLLPSNRWTPYLLFRAHISGVLLLLRVRPFTEPLPRNALSKSVTIYVSVSSSTTPWRRIGSGGIAPRIINVDTRWRWVIGFTPLPRGICDWMDLRTDPDTVQKRRSARTGSRTPVAQLVASSRY
jgi:hypothetical protein